MRVDKHLKMGLHNIAGIEQAIMQFADERQAAIYKRLFKTGKGEYGEGDHFLGVTNPKVRDNFLEAHVKEMPSVTISYAMEKMSEQERAYWRIIRNN